MKLYWWPKTRSLRALWMLEESGVPYERVLVDIHAGTHDTASFRAINPMTKVPALALMLPSAARRRVLLRQSVIQHARVISLAVLCARLY